MHITVIGTGYVGLVTAACLSEVGYHVVGLDTDKAKLARMEKGELPIHEPGLDEIVARGMASGRLTFTSDYALAMSRAEVMFLAVGTPPEEDGSADLSHVLAATREAARHVQNNCLFVTKSTVPVGTCRKVEEAAAEELGRRDDAPAVSVASNPEFLREGAAVDDFLKPDRIIVGVASEQDAALLKRLYAPFNRNRDRLVVMDLVSAEMSKYAANAMLATRISFMNEVARLCETVGADIEAVRRGLGPDPRIGPHFLYAGIGYGGSCFPKDVRALIATGREHGVTMSVVEAVHKVNRDQRRHFIDRLLASLQGNKKPRVALWGLAFKPDTDDMREAPSRDIVDALTAIGAEIRAHDPAAMPVCRDLWTKGEVHLMSSPEDCLDGADVLVLATEWLCFREPDWDEVARLMPGRLLFDGRNIYNPAEMTARGWQYYGIGRAVARA